MLYCIGLSLVVGDRWERVEIERRFVFLSGNYSS